MLVASIISALVVGFLLGGIAALWVAGTTMDSQDRQITLLKAELRQRTVSNNNRIMKQLDYSGMGGTIKNGPADMVRRRVINGF